MGGELLSPPRVFRPSVRRAVALLGGNADELPLLRAACLARSVHDASVQLCWVEGKGPPSRPLVRELALGTPTWVRCRRPGSPTCSTAAVSQR